MTIRRIVILALPLCIVLGAAAKAVDGGEVFDDECVDCHSVSKSTKNKKGPSLVGIFGAKAAAVAGATYSDALKASGLVWNAENLDAYIKNPKSVVPGGGTMKYDGLPDPSARAALIDFLKQH
jgi:cytochrome c